MPVMRTFTHLTKGKDFPKHLQALYSSGRQRTYKQVMSLLGAARETGIDPRIYPTTHHGESRIDNCIKYDLSDGYRCVTIQDGTVIHFVAVGKHDEVDRWLESNRGLTLRSTPTGSIEEVRVSKDIQDITTRVNAAPDYTKGRLLARLDASGVDELLLNVPASLAREFFELDPTVTDQELTSLCGRIQDAQRHACLFDVLMSLRAGNVAEAKRRLQAFVGHLKPLDDPALKEIELRDGDTVRIIRIDSPEYQEHLKLLMNKREYEEWLLFAHPEQNRVVARDFEGSAKLSGVSGSGKTCILVRRALRLAGENKARVLILTLNQSLALLINRLVDYACTDNAVRERVHVSSLFALCQKLLREREPENDKLYLDVTWKNGEHIDEIWREFYQCLNNNPDAQVLRELHISLTARGLAAEGYVRQEMDWVRSACRDSSRAEYATIERTGRAVPFDEDVRSTVLKGLNAWERKMRDVGVIDHLGLAVVLSQHLGTMTPRYNHVLVDEMQDFGTLELEIVRALVKQGPNDIFLCGDLAQRVQVKHQKLNMAGIEVPQESAVQIRQNYRNSREILNAARSVLEAALKDCDVPPGEVELLEPEYSNFSSAVPIALAAANPVREFDYALAMARDVSQDAAANIKACIAFAGFTLRDVQEFGRKVKLPVLDGTVELGEGRIFLSDLEQTKGFEFDEMYILNCRDAVLPQLGMPKGEEFRDLCRLYVAMTRTKRQLVLSYSGAPSRWLGGVSEALLARNTWEDFVVVEESARHGMPEHLHEVDRDVPWKALKGTEYIYREEAKQLSVELMRKMCVLVDGRVLIKNGQAEKWRNLGDAVKDVRKQPRAKQIWGHKLHLELLEHFKD